MVKDTKPSKRVRKLLRDQERLLRRISYRGFGQIPGFDYIYTSYNSIGGGTCDNTGWASDQLALTLVMSDSPLVHEIMKSRKRDPEKFDPEPLVKAKILKGMKILDLGCGWIPAFARCTRALGADTYTVDVIPANRFSYWRDKVFEDSGYKIDKNHQERKKLDAEKHVKVNLKNKKALDIILQATHGNFDLVTSAHMEDSGLYRGRFYMPPDNIDGIVFALLKPKGLYYKRELSGGLFEKD